MAPSWWALAVFGGLDSGNIYLGSDHALDPTGPRVLMAAQLESCYSRSICVNHIYAMIAMQFCWDVRDGTKTGPNDWSTVAGVCDLTTAALVNHSDKALQTSPGIDPGNR